MAIKEDNSNIVALIVDKVIIVYIMHVGDLSSIEDLAKGLWRI